MKRQWLLATGAALSVVPMMSLMTGCNGDNDNGGPFVPTPTATATAVPTGVAPQNFSAPVNLGSGRNGTLNLQVQGTQVTGNLVVRSAQTLVGTRAFSFAIPAGTYSFTGTFSPPRNFSVSGNFPAPTGNFSINGSLPTATSTGSFTVTAAGQTATGTIPALNATPTATATPINPTPSPTSVTPGTGSASFTFSNVSGSNVNTSRFSLDRIEGALNNKGVSGQMNIASIIAADIVTGQSQRLVNVTVPSATKLAVGQTFAIPTSGGTVVYTESSVSTTGVSTRIWNAVSGSMKIEAIGANNITVSFQSVRMQALAAGGSQGTGSFTFGGSVAANNLRTS
jgi:hypothetical protein